MVRPARLFVRCTNRRDVPVGRLPHTPHTPERCNRLRDASMRRLYARLYLRHEMHSATFLTLYRLTQTFASLARTIRMVVVLCTLFSVL